MAYGDAVGGHGQRERLRIRHRQRERRVGAEAQCGGAHHLDAVGHQRPLQPLHASPRTQGARADLERREGHGPQQLDGQAADEVRLARVGPLERPGEQPRRAAAVLRVR